MDSGETGLLGVLKTPFEERTFSSSQILPEGVVSDIVKVEGGERRYGKDIVLDEHGAATMVGMTFFDNEEKGKDGKSLLFSSSVFSYPYTCFFPFSLLPSSSPPNEHLFTHSLEVNGHLFLQNK